MNDTVPKRASFWRESLSNLPLFAKTEWQWIVIFAAVFAIEQRFSFLNNDSREILNQLVQAQGNATKHIEIINQYLPGILTSTAIALGTAALSAYVFTVLYLRQEMKEKAPKFSVSNFLYWLWIMIQKALVLYLPLFLILLIFIFTAAPTPSEAISSFINMFLILGTEEGALVIVDKGLSAMGPANLVLLFVGNIWFFYFYFCLYLFYLATPLAVLRRKPVLKISAGMTKKDVLRIWWESMIVLGVLFVVLLPFMALNFQLVRSFGAASPQAGMVSALMSGIWESVSGVSMAVYAVVVYRLLSKKQNKSPVL